MHFLLVTFGCKKIFFFFFFGVHPRIKSKQKCLCILKFRPKRVFIYTINHTKLKARSKVYLVISLESFVIKIMGGHWDFTSNSRNKSFVWIAVAREKNSNKKQVSILPGCRSCLNVMILLKRFLFIIPINFLFLTENDTIKLILISTQVLPAWNSGINSGSFVKCIIFVIKNENV